MSERETPTAAEPFADLFDTAPCGFLVLGPDGQIRRVNATLAAWLGIAADDLISKRLRDLLTISTRIFYETNFAPQLRLHGGFEEVALDMLTRDGGKLPVLVNAAERRDAGGLLVEIRVAIMRAGGRRSYEQDIRGREAAAVERLKDEKSASELREQFIAVLGHDLRNPLASIVGAARLLRREGLSDKGNEVLGLMETSVVRMSELIDDVLDFARGRLGSGIAISRKIAPLEPMLEQVVAELLISQPGRQIVFTHAQLAPVSFDKTRLAQLVSNLLGNALTHGDPEQPVRLDATTDQGQLMISVANAGEPIAEAAMARLFQPFFRGDVRSSQKGLGLGLHIASEIARAHNGRIAVHSDELETRFILMMPCAEAQTVTTAPGVSGSAAPPGVRP